MNIRYPLYEGVYRILTLINSVSARLITYYLLPITYLLLVSARQKANHNNSQYRQW